MLKLVELYLTNDLYKIVFPPQCALRCNQRWLACHICPFRKSCNYNIPCQIRIDVYGLCYKWILLSWLSRHRNQRLPELKPMNPLHHWQKSPSMTRDRAEGGRQASASNLPPLLQVLVLFWIFSVNNHLRCWRRDFVRRSCQVTFKRVFWRLDFHSLFNAALSWYK